MKVKDFYVQNHGYRTYEVSFPIEPFELKKCIDKIFNDLPKDKKIEQFIIGENGEVEVIFDEIIRDYTEEREI